MIITSTVKAIDTKTGRTRIFSVSELMESQPGHEENIRITLEHFGTLKMGDMVYHPVKGEPYIDLIGKSVLFIMKDGMEYLIKVQGVKFGEFITGFDDEGMNRGFKMDFIDSYYLPGMGMKR